MVAYFKNKHGQEPSPPLSSNAPLFVPPAPKPGQRQIPSKSRLLQRMGFEPLDLKQCQAPIVAQNNRLNHVRCTNPATCVMVENEPRDGRIAAMTLCDFHKDVMLVTHPDYATITPLPKG